MPKPENPYRPVKRESTDGPVRFTSLSYLNGNPLIKQQQIPHGLRLGLKENRSQLYEKLLAGKNPEGIMCGVASALTCIRAIATENNWSHLPNFTSASSIVGPICEKHGAASTDPDPETGVPFDEGWHGFKNTESDISNWDIYHHALAYGIEQSGEGKITTSGIKDFELADLKVGLDSGIKFIISVDNSIIEESQLREDSPKLGSGTHLVSVLEIGEDSKWVIIGDPYIETFSQDSTEAIPKLIRVAELEKFLADKDSRRGIAVASSSVDLQDLLSEIGYLLPKPT